MARDVKVAAALPAYAPATGVAAVASVDGAPTGAIVVECVQEGGRLRVHAVSEGYDPSMKVQFPRAIRERGALRRGRPAHGCRRLPPGPR